MQKLPPRVYVASKLRHADKFIELRTRLVDIHFTARWTLMHGKVDDDEKFALQFWQDDFDDIARADCVLVWGEPEDKLRGALVEAGIAIGLGKPVFLAGDHYDYGTWKFHPLVIRRTSIETALKAIHEHFA